jgi:Putative metallopeptidase
MLMNILHGKMGLALAVITLFGLNSAFAQSQISSFQADRISIAYNPPGSGRYQDVYELLRQHNALERIKEILSPFRLPEQLTIETAECGAVNSYYQRKNFKPTVTICYEFLKRILELLPTKRPLTDLLRRMQPLDNFSG